VVVNNQPMTMRPMGKERVVKGVTVYGHSGEGWASTGFDWPQYDYRVTNLGADGSVPAVPPTPWLDDNMVRTRPVAYYPEANLQVEIIDVCAAGCEEHSPVEVSVQVSNTGTMEIPAGLSVALYAEDGVHNWTLLGVQVTTAALPAGESSDALLYDITLPDLGEWGLVARVDDDGMGVTAIDECLEDDNVDRWRGAICDYTGYEGARKRRPDHGWRIVPIFGDDGRFEIGLEE